jgi:cytidylate kinase
MKQEPSHTMISIAGDLGSGKSLIGKLLAEKTGFKFYSTGSFQRDIAAQHGITTLELNKRSEETFKFDKEIDASTRKLSESGKPFIIDSRMAWYFIPNSFKIFLKVNVDIAAKRIFNDKSRKNEKYPDLESTKKDIIRRKKSELFRFKKYYKVDCDNMEHYDLVIDTSDSTPEEIVKTILSHLFGPG